MRLSNASDCVVEGAKKFCAEEFCDIISSDTHGLVLLRQVIPVAREYAYRRQGVALRNFAIQEDEKNKATKKLVKVVVKDTTP